MFTRNNGEKAAAKLVLRVFKDEESDALQKFEDEFNKYNAIEQNNIIILVRKGSVNDINDHILLILRVTRECLSRCTTYRSCSPHKASTPSYSV